MKFTTKTLTWTVKRLKKNAFRAYCETTSSCETAFLASTLVSILVLQMTGFISPVL